MSAAAAHRRHGPYVAVQPLRAMSVILLSLSARLYQLSQYEQSARYAETSGVPPSGVEMDERNHAHQAQATGGTPQEYFTPRSRLVHTLC